MHTPTDAGRLIITPHPVMLDGQRNLQADLRPGESLYAFLERHVEGLGGQAWLVTIGGRSVERHLWSNVYPKHGQVIEIRGVVGKSAIRLVAQVALAYFTLGGAAIAGFSIGTSTVLGTTLARAAVYAAGSLLINKVLGPKLPSAAASAPADTLFSISAPRNRMRAYEPLSFVLGTVRIAPDVASKPYMNYEGDEQYLSLVLTPGLNVARVDELYNGDALLSSYEGVQVWHSGFPSMPDEAIPLYSNSGSVDGGVILDTSSDPKHTPSNWVQRTSSAGAIRLQVNMDFRIFDADKKGRDYENREQIQIQYRAVGESGWRVFGNYTVAGRTQKSRRATYGLDVPAGQYEVRVRTAGLNTDGNNAQASFSWTNLVSVLPDTASYDGIPRIGIRMKASGQLNGSPDELRCVAHSFPIPVWKGDAIGWVTEESSNPGAQILAYARGIKSPQGVRIAGMGLPDSQIDVEALKAFMLHCAANGFSYDYQVAEKRNHQAVMDAVALAGFGQIAWPKGRLAVVWAADEQPLSGVVNMATIKKGQFQVEYTLANGADGIEYSYLDRATWEAKTLRVPAPGVTTMLNPAQVTGEGVTSEAHAAMLARWHLAQSLYQYKSISYSTDIEHLAYGRMSVLALQHDLTQWGFGGQVLSASMGPGRVVTLQLDVPVPAPAQGSAYIGLRIPGERVYRVLRVVPFTGESDQLQLADPWPTDAELPGNTDSNPAWDTIWIYDFKQTPGYRVRVVGIQPENDLKGAAVDVVAEGPEYWHYVKTGEYIPPENGSQLGSRPVASNLRITERQVVQGDTVFSELQASFDITGPVGEIRVLSDLDQNSELEQVASTTTRSAVWRIPRAGVYPITVRPYSPDGQAGVAVTVTYATQGADVPPVLVDLFDVEERSGGVRLYTWGWLGDTTRSADFAGVEIRYMPGKDMSPDWNAMTPVGETGYHTAPFEAVIPESGDWTFACRSVNTSGELSTGMRVVVKTLGNNLGEQMQETWEEAERANQRVGQEIIDRLAGDVAAVNEAVGKARQYTDEQVAALNGILEDIVGADEWAAGTTYPAGDFVRRAGTLYRALAENVDVEPGTNPAVWEAIGDYTSVGDALAAAISMSTKNASDIEAEASRVDAVVARMPAGAGALATSAQVASEQQARADADSALGQRLDSTNAALGDKASTASVNAVEQASVARDNALGQRIDSTDAELAGKASAAGLQQLASQVNDLGDSVEANSTAITHLTVGMNPNPNMLKNPSWRNGLSGWGGTPTNGAPLNYASHGPFLAIQPATGSDSCYQYVQSPTAGVHYLSGEVFRNGSVGNARLVLSAYNAGGLIGSVTVLSDRSKLGVWQALNVPIDVPPDATRLLAGVICEGTGEVMSFRRLKLERGPSATPWSDEVTTSDTATAMQSMEVRATALENGQTTMFAKYTWALDVNGRVIGMTSVNNGLVGRVDFVADVFSITDPNNTGSTTFEQGRWITRSGPYMMVHGKPFGVSNDLMMWFGVGSNPANASKANALFWIDNQGSGYFGGSLSAGVLKNAVQTTSTNGNAEIINGPFSTLGRAKNVVVSYDMTKTDTANTGRWTGVSGPVNATIAIYRRVGNGAEQFITNFNVTGNYEVLNEQGGPSQLTSRMAGSHTFTDNTPGTEQFTYRAIITTRNVATGTASGGTVGVVINQTLGIISVEQ
ncbi:host specificity factor TipJ family phage tail protein [Stenotrophomonas maltophilia]|uniref:host specificity factor TipJ family phage tail protein n=1 Tax=Stenotrophomonas maltophilia TaxID=40324 RepID=UPI001EF81FAA|nr:host specificity factor TipJ family phage tail protein [Stenotrophomonas maltophilia]